MNTTATKPKPEPLGLPKVTIEIEQITPEQRRKGEQGTIKRIDCAHSWVRGMIDLMIVYLSNTDGNIVNTGSASVEIDASNSQKFSFLFANAGVGVQVGTGTTAVDRDDDNLETTVVNGSGSGQLTFAVPCTLTKAAAVTGGYRIILERAFDNDSGGDITITEAGIIVASRLSSGGPTVSPLILRDIISPGHLIEDGGAVILRYILDWLV